MKIIHWEDSFHPRFGYDVNVLSKFQARMGHEVIIYSSQNVENNPYFRGIVDKNTSAADNEFSERYNVKIVRLPNWGVISGRVIFKPGFIKRIRDEKPDILMCHGNDTLSGICITLHHKDVGCPIIFDNHMLEMASANPMRKLFRFFYCTCIAPVIAKNKFMVIRTQNDSYVNRCLGIPVEQSPFISFGTDTTLFFHDDTAKKAFRDKHGIAEDDFVVIYAGKLDEGKGGKILAQAFKEKLDTDRNVVLVVVGSTRGEYGAEVENIFSESQNRILRFPAQAYVDLAPFYQSADLSLFPKQCSLSFYDVQACGVPVILEDNHVNMERVSYGNGLTYKKDDILDLRNKLEFCMNMSKAEFKELQDHSWEFIKKDYDYENITRHLLSMYQDVIVKYKKG